MDEYYITRLSLYSPYYNILYLSDYLLVQGQQQSNIKLYRIKITLETYCNDLMMKYKLIFGLNPFFMDIKTYVIPAL